MESCHSSGLNFGEEFLARCRESSVRLPLRSKSLRNLVSHLLMNGWSAATL